MQSPDANEATTLSFKIPPNAASSVIEALLTLREGIADLPDGLLDPVFRLLDFPDSLIDISAIRADQSSAAGAIEFEVLLHPSERLLDLVAAFGARDWERAVAVLVEDPARRAPTREIQN
jgi:hypothetical protein